MGDGSSERAAVADLEVPDQRRRAGEEGHPRGHLGVVLDRRVDRRRADHDRVAVGVDPAELVDAADVDEVVEVGEPERDHRHEALTSGEHLGAVAELREQRDGFVDALGGVIVERRGLHRRPARSSITARLPNSGGRSRR